MAQQIKRESPDSRPEMLAPSDATKNAVSAGGLASPFSIAGSSVEISSNSSDSSKSCHGDGVHVKSIEGRISTAVADGCSVSEATRWILAYVFKLLLAAQT